MCCFFLSIFGTTSLVLIMHYDVFTGESLSIKPLQKKERKRLLDHSGSECIFFV